jgi:hypothetical protein
MEIKTTTWKRDSHGLYDYESSSVDKKSFKESGSVKILRNDDNYIQIKQLNKLDTQIAQTNNSSKVIANVFFYRGINYINFYLTFIASCIF